MEPARSHAGWWRHHEVGLAVAALVGVVIAVLIERRGVIATADGIVYTGTATNLSGGRGLTVPFSGYTDQLSPIDAAELGDAVPLRHWPPLFPVGLALGRLVGLTATATASVLNPLLLGCNVVLLGVLTRRWFVRAWPALFVATLLLVALRDPQLGTSSLVVLHATTLAEPLVTTWTLLALLLVDRFLVDADDRWFWGAAVAAGLATATKFNAAPLVAVVVCVGAVAPGAALRRGLRAAGALVVGFAVSAPWLLRAGADRVGSPPGGVGGALEELGAWTVELFVPASWPTPARAVVLVAVVAVAGLGLFRSFSDASARAGLVRLAPLCGASVMLVLQVVLTRAFVDQYVGVGGRQLVVVHVLVVVLLLALVSRAAGDRIGQLLGAVAVGSWVLLSAAAGASSFTRFVTDPIEPPVTDAVERAVSEVPEGVVVFTNVPDVVHVATGRSAHMLPCATDYFTGAFRAEYADELDELRELVRQGVASVVIAGGLVGRAAECGSLHPFEDQVGLEVEQAPSAPAVVRASR